MIRILSLIFTIILSSCATTNDINGRMYNLKDDSVIEIKLSNFNQGYGTASAKFPHGETFSGEYTLTTSSASRIPTIQKLPKNAASQTQEAIKADKKEPGWAEVYGNPEAKPVGTATLLGNKGTLINIVFFTADTVRGIGDGVARSNTGQWYRVHFGDE